VKIFLDCFPCFLRQALEAGRIAGADEGTQREVLERVMETLLDLSSEETPPQIGSMIHDVIRKATGNSDPYREIKRRHNEQALGMEEELAGFISRISFSPVGRTQAGRRGESHRHGPRANVEGHEGYIP